jgi:enoyl-CoA hydratase/carnithine racemase
MSQDERFHAREIEDKKQFVGHPKFEEYCAKYARYFRLERQNGVLQVRMHTADGPAVYGFNLHNAWKQLWIDIGNDPDNEVLILVGTGDEWVNRFEADFPTDIPGTLNQWPPDVFHDQAYVDATKVLEAFIFNVDIPTIACINGPGFHTDIALLCDITLCAEHAELFDPHFAADTVPGDGQALTFQELMGVKRAAYYMYTCDRISTQVAKELGLVNEVLPLDRLLPRAQEIAAMIMRRPRHVRRFTSAVVRRQWKRRLVEDLAFHISHEMLGIRLSK